MGREVQSEQLVWTRPVALPMAQATTMPLQSLASQPAVPAVPLPPLVPPPHPVAPCHRPPGAHHAVATLLTPPLALRPRGPQTLIQGRRAHAHQGQARAVCPVRVRPRLT